MTKEELDRLNMQVNAQSQQVGTLQANPANQKDATISALHTLMTAGDLSPIQTIRIAWESGERAARKAQLELEQARARASVQPGGGGGIRG